MSKTVTLLYGNKDLLGPWVPQWESCFGFQAQPHDFQDIWHILSSSCDTPGQLPWNQHKANDSGTTSQHNPEGLGELRAPKLNSQSSLGKVCTKPHNKCAQAHAFLEGDSKKTRITQEQSLCTNSIHGKQCVLRAHIPW